MSVYCELGLGTLSSQPINTISNLAFLIAAFFALRLLQKEKIHNELIWSLPIVGIGIGLGSMLWHGIPHPLSDLADILPIFFFAGLTFFYLLSYLFKRKATVFGIITLMVVTELAFSFEVLPTLNGFLPYLILLLFSLVIFFLAGERRVILQKPLIGILGLFIVSLGFRTLDLYLCQWIPFGSHFMWHILNGVMTYYVVKLLVRIEKGEVVPTDSNTDDF